MNEHATLNDYATLVKQQSDYVNSCTILEWYSLLTAFNYTTLFFSHSNSYSFLLCLILFYVLRNFIFIIFFCSTDMLLLGKNGQYKDFTLIRLCPSSGVWAQSAAPGPSRKCRPLVWAVMLYSWRHNAQSTMVWSFVFWSPFRKSLRQI